MHDFDYILPQCITQIESSCIYVLHSQLKHSNDYLPFHATSYRRGDHMVSGLTEQVLQNPKL